MPNADKVIIIGGDGLTALSSTNPLPIDSSSSSPVSILDGAGTDTSGSLANSTDTVVASSIDGYSNVTVTFKGTYAGLSGVFEQSDDSGTTWFPVDAARLGTGLVESSVTNLTNQTIIWRATISGCDSFRVRATALTSGTVNVLMSFSAIPTAAGAGVTANFTDSRPAAGTITIQDTNSSTATGQNGASLVTGTPTASSTFALALNGYSGFYALVTGTWTGSLTFEKSIDSGTTWTPFSVHIDSTAYTQITITGNCSVRSAGAGATNVRLRATAAMTGTVNVQFVFASADTVTTVTNAVRLFDNTSGASATIKAASTVPVAADPAIVVALSPNTSVWTYANISTSTTTQVKSGAGVLHAVVVNTSGTVASSVSIYDSTTTTTPVVAIVNALATGYYIFDAAVATGIRVVTTGTVAPNVTVLYR